MLTLAKTPQNDNQVTFLVKILKQGANILLNGSFSSSSNWTVDGGDWSIADGLLKYIYSAPEEGGVIHQTISPDTDIYVFEYEVVYKTGINYRLTLDSTFTDSAVVSDVELDLTIGKHAVNVRLSSSGDKFPILAEAFGSGDEVHIDNVCLRKINDVIRASSKKDFTVGSYTYSHGLLFQDTGRVIGNVSKQVDITLGGSIGSLESFDFSIANFSDYFIDDFYPNNGEPDLSGAKVELYVVWDNLTYTTEDDMLLLNVYYVNENYNENNKMTFFSIEYSDLEGSELPRYSIQKEYDDGISYFPYADDSVVGTPIPIVYGSFNVWQPVPNHAGDLREEYVLTPAILVNNANLQFVVSSHICKTDSWNSHGKTGDTNVVFKYLKGFNTYMLCFKSGESASANNNTWNGYTFIFMYTVSRLYGDLLVNFKQISAYTAQTDVEDSIDTDPLTYSQIDRFEITATNKLAVNIPGKESTANVGWLGSQAGDILVVFAIKLEDDSSGNYRIGERNNTLPTPANSETPTSNMSGSTVIEKTSDISGVTSIKKDAVLPWTIEELSNLEYYIVNYGADTVGKKINVYYGFLKMININVTGFDFITRGYGRIATPNVTGTGIKITVGTGWRR